jgi:hypothetical protein
MDSLGSGDMTQIDNKLIEDEVDLSKFIDGIVNHRSINSLN